jgi:hypothetical protein
VNPFSPRKKVPPVRVAYTREAGVLKLARQRYPFNPGLQFVDRSVLPLNYPHEVRAIRSVGDEN